MYQVIIAEDEFFVRLGIKNSVSWEKYNMQVVCDAGNGAEALRAIQKSCPDVLITDLLMPGMGGQQLIESVRDAGLEPYIIVITCLEEFKTLQKMMSLGVRDYLLKATMTEAEIQASLQKAREALDKQARQLEPARAPAGNRFSQLMQAYLADESLCRQTQGALEELNLSVSGALPVVLGTIAEVYKADSPASLRISARTWWIWRAINMRRASAACPLCWMSAGSSCSSFPRSPAPGTPQTSTPCWRGCGGSFRTT